MPSTVPPCLLFATFSSPTPKGNTLLALSSSSHLSKFLPTYRVYEHTMYIVNIDSTIWILWINFCVVPSNLWYNNYYGWQSRQSAAVVCTVESLDTIFESYSWKRLEAWTTVLGLQDAKIQSWDSSFTLIEFQETRIFEFKETKSFSRKEQ